MYPLAHIGIPLLLTFTDNRSYLDIRILLIGSILPDLIDKPLGHLLLPLNNGRIYAHTVLFLLVLAALSLKFRKIIPLTIGVGMHQLLDMTFLEPRTALWPLLGHFETTAFSTHTWIHHLSSPDVIVGEAVGLAIILICILRCHLYRPRGFKDFIRSGNIQLKGRPGGE